MVNVNQMDGRETTSSVKGKRDSNWIANLLTGWLADSRHSPLEIDFQWIEEDWEMIQSCFVLSSLKIIESILSSCTNSRPLDNNSLAFLASSQFKKWKSWKKKSMRIEKQVERKSDDDDHDTTTLFKTEAAKQLPTWE